ncbi:hypothetical protein HMPREF1383_02914 [Enterococcus faecium V689]|uniref:Uncharacterized protein n=3 Tax=Enterococcus faecium TaxID=1352 RepID=J6KCD3_ENTFC|nr:hypothetical protein HMPREF9522_02712 [Enterococcus faecium TX0082]EJX37072.1 hypothetical protein HMPREF1383_02914 [Enterococcus faecium V689]EJX39178.1 hypothetical protein HMPREF1382_02612 [Enterococcus faecium S447]EJX40810.1 hypothetical protein HMPREF1381_01881 [Enterococcus faecium R501]EJX45886.1 hypothetical protein HMPREF1380_02871 [Enterococcus faecium R499]EJX47000.1 hypothetical protein HMPREF1379_03246 [Enterococcus faecium R497]EJX50756.1 hypothetical protein HMPREF1378_0224
MIFCNNGIDTPTPQAWIKRPISNVLKLGAVKQVIVPIKKIVMAERYKFLELNLLISHAVIGIMIPLTSKKPVVNHCTSDAEISKAFINVGKAVVNKV